MSIIVLNNRRVRILKLCQLIKYYPSVKGVNNLKLMYTSGDIPGKTVVSRPYLIAHRSLEQTSENFYKIDPTIKGLRS